MKLEKMRGAGTTEMDERWRSDRCWEASNAFLWTTEMEERWRSDRCWELAFRLGIEVNLEKTWGGGMTEMERSETFIFFGIWRKQLAFRWRRKRRRRRKVASCKEAGNWMEGVCYAFIYFKHAHGLCKRYYLTSVMKQKYTLSQGAIDPKESWRLKAVK